MVRDRALARSLSGLVELEEQRLQLGESVLSELRLPVSLDLPDGVADRVGGHLGEAKPRSVRRR